MPRNHEDEEPAEGDRFVHEAVVNDGLATGGDQAPASSAIPPPEQHDVSPARNSETADHNASLAARIEEDEARLAEINKDLDLAQMPCLEKANISPQAKAAAQRAGVRNSSPPCLRSPARAEMRNKYKRSRTSLRIKQTARLSGKPVRRGQSFAKR